jgi:rhodanese-related sulfurtransferase
MNHPTIKEITCAELHALSKSRPVDLIDVRTVEEFVERRAAGARNIPMDTVDPHALHASRTTPPGDPLYFICEMGGRSAWVCGIMMAAGYPNVVNVLGGTHEWALSGLPLQHGT